jgi:hypothetical protein
VGALQQNALVERIDLPPPAALLRARRPPPQAGEVSELAAGPIQPKIIPP